LRDTVMIRESWIV